MKINEKLNAKGIATELSERCRQYRIAYPLTREELSEKAFVSAGTIARFEGGRDISIVNFIKILDALGLTENIDLLIPDYGSRPSSYVQDSVIKKRARKKKNDSPDGTAWKWGDER